MLETILKDIKIASIAGRTISILAVVRKLIITAVIIAFAVQIGKFLLEEKANLPIKWGE